MNFENFATKKVDNNIVKEFPEDYPMYPKSSYDYSTRAGMPNDDKQIFFDNKGNLDENSTTRLWYGVASAAKINGYFVPLEDPKTIELGGLLAIDHIQFKECFKKSGAYLHMVSLPENDAERQRLLEFQTDLIMRSFHGVVRQKINNIPGLEDTVKSFVKAKIQYEADCVRADVLSRKGDSVENTESDENLSKDLYEKYLTAKQALDEAMEINKIYS